MKKFLIALLITGFIVSVAFAEESPERTGKSGFGKKRKLGGPCSTSAQLEEDDELKKPVFRYPWFESALEPWFDFKGEGQCGSFWLSDDMSRSVQPLPKRGNFQN